MSVKRGILMSMTVAFIFQKQLLITLLGFSYASSSSVILDRIKSLKVSCPCLKPFGEPIKTVKTDDVTSCFSACHAATSCTGFSYCDHSRECSLYSIETLGFTADAVNSFDCTKNPFDSPLDWYLKAENFDANTTNCQDVYDSGFSSDGYYNVWIRGRRVEVYCLMSVSPIKTYIDISAFTTFGGDSVNPSVLVDYSRAEVKYDKCLILLVKHNQEFANPKSNETATGLGMGGNCDTLENGKHKIDLRMTQFQFSTDVKFQFGGSKAVIISENFTSRYSYLEGNGDCGNGNAYSKNIPSELYDDYIPLQLFPSTRDRNIQRLLSVQHR